ncbi:MAG: TIM barrel protein [Armatimonadetes bacterium]|nr:TIM barrel protein [Armatimonadota bacterium]MDE2206498.1 TIM barrel protein [Armatimonadota bacterium]
MKQSFAWWCFHRDGNDPVSLLRDAKRIGYHGVEMIPRESWAMVRDAGLAIATMGGHGTLTNGLNRAENHDRIEREINDNLVIAGEWGVPVMIVFSGNRDGISDSEGLDVTAEGLARVARAAESAGVVLTLELLNSKVNHPDYQCDHTSWGVEVCRLVNSPSVKLLYDIYHMQIMEGDVIRTIRDNAQWIGHYHTAGNPGRHELDDTQELNYRGISKAIAETGYTGYIGQELVPEGDIRAAMQQAFDACAV